MNAFKLVGLQEIPLQLTNTFLAGKCIEIQWPIRIKVFKLVGLQDMPLQLTKHFLAGKCIEI